MKVNILRLGLGILAVFCATVALWPSPARADRGAITTVGEVNIEEPAQRAIIAHSGTREIIILQTDVKADRETKVVEFMPLPSKPEVSLAPEGCFAALAKIIKKHKVRYVVKSREGGQQTVSNVSVVVAAQLGPHDVTVVEVKDADAFVTWVKAFFDEKDLGKPNLGDNLREVVADYLKRDLRFFAFDVVALSPKKKTVQPLAYEFACSRFYYPLKVTNLYGGTGTVELFTIVPQWLQPGWMQRWRTWISSPGAIPVSGRHKNPLPPGTSRLLHSTGAFVSLEELNRVHPKITDLMGGCRGVLRAVKYDGPLKFDADIWLADQNSSYLPDGVCRRFLQALELGDVPLLKSLVHAPFVFDGKEVIRDKDKLMARLGKLLEERKGKTVVVDKLEQWKWQQDKNVLEAAGDDLKVRDLTKDFILGHRKRHILRVLRATIGGEHIVFVVGTNAQGNSVVVGFED